MHTVFTLLIEGDPVAGIEKEAPFEPSLFCHLRHGDTSFPSDIKTAQDHSDLSAFSGRI